MGLMSIGSETETKVNILKTVAESRIKAPASSNTCRRTNIQAPVTIWNRRDLATAG